MNYLIRGYYGSENIGDDALIYSIVKEINNRNEKSEFLIISKKALTLPREVDESRITYVPPTMFDFIRGLINSDVLLFGGGGQFQNVKNNFLSRGLIMQTMISIVARILNKRVQMISVSFGPLKNKLDKVLLKTILKLSSKVNVRDKDSYNIAKKLNYQGDLSLSLDIAGTLAKDVSISRNKKRYEHSTKKVIGISIIPIHRIRFNEPEQDRQFLKNFSDILVKASHGEDYKFKIFVFHGGDERGDESFSENLREILASNDIEAKIVPYQPYPKKILSEFNSCDAFIGMRLHSLEFASIMNLPFLGLSYHPKVEGFMDMIKVNNKLINVYDFKNDEKTLKEVKKLLMNETTININENLFSLLKNQETTLNDFFAER